MGKSLSILALVATTLQRSHDWASEQDINSPSGEQKSQTRSGATLIVVPSVGALSHALSRSSFSIAN